MAIWRRENIHQHVNGTAPGIGVLHDVATDVKGMKFRQQRSIGPKLTG